MLFTNYMLPKPVPCLPLLPMFDHFQHAKQRGKNWWRRTSEYHITARTLIAFLNQL